MEPGYPALRTGDLLLSAFSAMSIVFGMASLASIAPSAAVSASMFNIGALYL